LFGWVFGFFRLRGVLEALEFRHGFLVGLFHGIHAAVQALKGGSGFGERLAEFDSGGVFAETGLVLPELGLDAVIAAGEPLVQRAEESSTPTKRRVSRVYQGDRGYSEIQVSYSVYSKGNINDADL
jgi:hypothetical protein